MANPASDDAPQVDDAPQGTAGYQEWAATYDALVHEYDSYGHDVLFGMSYEHVAAGQTLLDLGIGTGLASAPFARAGLRVCGVDRSPDMLAACRSKGIAAELRQHDVQDAAIPYPDAAFDHVISCGVLHFLGDLQPLMAEVQRVIRPAGVFAFTYAPLAADDPGPYRQEPTAWDQPIFRHAPQYINAQLNALGLEPRKEQRLLIKGADKRTHDMLFAAIVARGAPARTSAGRCP